MTFADLKTLHAIIGSAIEDVERIYRERSQAIPLEYPSINVPYYATAPHTAEEELAENLKSDPLVALASKQIVAACGQLSATVNKPWFALMEDGQLSSAIRFLEAANIVEILREAGPEGGHVRDIYRAIIELRSNSKLAGLTATAPLTPSNLSHILRLLATSHYLCEVKPDVFANNRPSSFIDSGKTVEQLREKPDEKYVETDGIAAFVALAGDEALKFMSCLTEWALPEKRLAGSRNAKFTIDLKGPRGSQWSGRIHR